MFLWRLLLLTVLLMIFAYVDLRVNKEHAQRWREYLMLYLVAACGALFALINDLMTATLSPEYFIYGKSLAAGDGFLWRVVALALQAGAVAGFIIGAVLLCVERNLAIKNLFRYIAIIAVSAVVSAIALGLLCLLMYPRLVDAHLFSGLDLDPEQQRNFIIVWSIHFGHYLGALISLLLVCVKIKRDR